MKKKQQQSVDRDWDFITSKQQKAFIKMYAWMNLKAELAHGGFWGVRESKKLGVVAETLKIKLFQDIYKTHPHWEGKCVRAEIYQNKLFAFEPENPKQGII